MSNENQLDQITNIIADQFSITVNGEYLDHPDRIRSAAKRCASAILAKHIVTELRHDEAEPTLFVPLTYEMDPEFEDMLPNGKCLRNGMVVLIGDAIGRYPIPNADSHPVYIDLAKATNRWCTVSDVEYNGSQMTFIGTYGDGTKRQRSYNTSMAWLVKKDSIPGPSNNTW